MHRSKNRVSNDVARHYAPPSPSATPHWRREASGGRRHAPLRGAPSNTQEDFQMLMIAYGIILGGVMGPCVFLYFLGCLAKLVGIPLT